jgi:hypothetical protein
MSEDEFLEVVDESLLPTATARFQRSSVTFLEDFYFSAMFDQFPPKSRDLSPFASLWCSMEWSINKDLRFIAAMLKNC